MEQCINDHDHLTQLAAQPIFYFDRNSHYQTHEVCMSPLFAPKDNDDWFLPKDARQQLEETFKSLKNPIKLEVFAQAGTNDEFNEYMVKFCKDLDRLSDKISLQQFGFRTDRAKELGITQSPTMCLNPDDYYIRFLGAPLGEEGKAFITAIVLASMGDANLSDMSKQLLEPLNEERLAQVFVSPT